MSGNIFYGTRGNRTADIMIVAESWGVNEARQQKPLVGESGQDLDRMLADAQIPQNKLFFTNVVSARPVGNDMKQFFYKTGEARAQKLFPRKGLYPQDIVVKGLETLKQQIAAVKPKLIIGFGNYALWALTEDCFSIADEEGYKTPTGIGQWRGSQLHTSHEFGRIPFLPTYHPAAGLRTYAWRYMIRHDLKTRVKLAFDAKTWNEPNYDFTIRPSFESVTAFLLQTLRDLVNGPVELVLDLETSISKRIISCVGLARSMHSAICIPFLCASRVSGYWSQTEEFEIVKLLREILAHPNLRLIGHHLLFDVQYIIDQLWVKPRIFFDTMIAQHTLWPGGGDPLDAKGSRSLSQGIQRKALYNCASLYCEYYRYWKDEGKDIDTSPNEDIGWNYNCKDCVNTFEVFETQQPLIQRYDLTEQFAFQMRVANDMALSMMTRGIRVNQETKKKVGEELSSTIKRYDERLSLLMPEEVRKEVEPKAFKKDKKTGEKRKTQWYESPKQQAKIFYDMLNIKPVLKPKTKKPTLDKDALPVLAQREPIIAPIVDKLEIRRSLGVFNSTFAEAETDPDDRMRCSYNVTGTDTFRFSSSENIYGRGGNLQNIPSGKTVDEIELDFEFPNMRKHFEPDAGYELAEFDLSGADAQVVAWEANDNDLKDAFRKGLKLHIKNARDIFPHRTKDMTDEELKATDHQGGIYHNCKRGVHGTNYGVQAQSLAYKLRWKLAEAEEFQERWFQLHPNILGWQRRVERCLNGLQCWRCFEYSHGAGVCPRCKAHVGRTVGNKFGYRVVYFDRINNLLNKGLAWTPQSTVGINTNKGAIALVDNVPWVELLLQVHDSLIVQYPIRYSDRLSDIKTALHSVTVPYDDPLTIPWGVKVSRKSWGEAEAVKW